MSMHHRHLAAPIFAWALRGVLPVLLVLVVGCGSSTAPPNPDPRSSGAPEPTGGETTGSVDTTDAAPRVNRTGIPVFQPIPPDRLPMEPTEPVAPPRPELPREARALWVVRDAMVTPDRVRTMVADAAGAGITDLLVQIRGRGDAYYRSDLVMTAPRLARTRAKHPGFDPLALTLELAHAHGMRVHAWMNVYLVWGKGAPPANHVAATQPGWVAETLDGRRMDSYTLKQLLDRQTEGTYLEPGNHEVVAHFDAVVTEVLENYAVDGIHLDYVRYPQMDVGYSKNMRAGFHRRTGVDPVILRASPQTIANERGEAGLLELERAWIDFKASQITALVARVHQRIVATRPGAMLSAAVKPDADVARERNGQDWVRWVDEGLVDVVAPMMYSTKDATIVRQARDLASRVPPERIWAGIAVYNQPLDRAADKIRHVRAAGIEGISIFSYNSIPGGAEGLSDLNRVR